MSDVDLFAGPLDLLDSAQGHLDEIVEIMHELFDPDWASLAREQDPNTGDTLFKVVFSKGAPIRLATRVFNVVTELRSALDHSVYAATRALTGRTDPTKAKFPFGDTAADLEQNFMWLSDHVPAPIFKVIFDLKPYATGNRMLWSLNKLRNAKDHTRLIVPAPAAKLMDAQGNLDGLTLSGASPDNGYVVARAPSNAKGDLNVGLFLHVAFGEVEAVKGVEPVGYLLGAHAAVSDAVDAIKRATIEALNQDPA